MSAALWLDILLAWSAQICVVVALGALAAMTLAHPKARLLFWQGLLVLLLLLPLMEPWRQPLPEGVPAIADTLPKGSGPIIAMPPPALWRREYWLAVVGLGCALRLLWIAIGFLRLRRYHQEARVLAEPPVPFRAATARWYLHDHVAGPVTYGWLRPSILLPAHFEQMPASIREAIACHELVHVHRRDWLFVIAEEIIRSAFWFHPAVWFVLSRIQLAREQSVDREVVRLTEDRDCYLDALVAVAAQKIRPDVAPAPLFLKKRHLAARVAAVLQEVSMSKSRVYASFATVCSCLLLAGRLSVWLFPFASPAQVVPDDPGITVDAGGKLLHRTPVHAPAGQIVAGSVTLEASLNARGEVTDARVLSGPDELRRAALASVLDWHYAADAGLSRAVVTMTFNKRMPVREAAREAPLFGTIGSISFVGISAEQEAELRSLLALHNGDSFTSADLDRIHRTVREFDSHLGVKVSQKRGSVEIGHYREYQDAGLVIGLLNEREVPVVAVAENFPPPAPGVKRLKINGGVQARNLVAQPHPVYPPLAKQAHVQGIVRFNALIGLDGAIKALQLVEGPELLTTAATDSVKQWTYRPTLLNGDPVEVVTQIDVNFTLAR